MKKSLDFEVNILPILDILSVLICFLLLTAVWIQMGSIDTKQAMGDNSTNGSENPPSIWATLSPSGEVEISLRDVKKQMPLEYKISAGRGGVDWDALKARVTELKTQLPDLKTGVIRPEAKANYGDVIRMMDSLKQTQITDIGLSPLG